nr:MAG TPA: hypothetical protein [Caudoviricetes sp.]
MTSDEKDVIFFIQYIIRFGGYWITFYLFRQVLELGKHYSLFG